MRLSSKELLEKIPPLVDGMKFILHSNSKVEVQIADINHLCWTIVELCVKVQEAVDYELVTAKERRQCGPQP